MKPLFFNVIFICFLLGPGASHAQAYADEITAFKKADSTGYPFTGKHPIVFTGSSSIRLWHTLQSDFDGYPVLNRGFGGSSLQDMIFYAGDIILKYYPKQVVIYCGENDLAQADSISAEIVFSRFKKLFFIIRQKLPNTSIVFISLKPSPSRKKIQPKLIEANRLIRNYLSQKSGTAYIDVYHAMLNTDSTMRPELFTNDSLHMNEKGYAIWQEMIKPYLTR